VPEDALKEDLKTAIERDEPFGPANDDDSLQELPAATLREAILSLPALPADGTKRLRLRRVQVVGALDLEAQRIGLRLQLFRCQLTGDLNLYQAWATDIALIKCVLSGGLYANQLELCWNLQLSGSEVGRGVALAGAKIGGRLFMNDTTLAATTVGSGVAGTAFDADGAQVSGDVLCRAISSVGEIRLLGTKIGGLLYMEGATLKAATGEGLEAKRAFNADGAKIGGDLFYDGMSSVGEIRLLGAKIGGQLSLKKATLKAVAGDVVNGGAFNADGIEVSRSLVCDEVSSEGEMRIPGATIGGQLSMDNATLGAMAGEDEVAEAAFNADGVEVSGGMFCRETSSTGEVRLLGARIGVQLSMSKATFKATAGRDGVAGVAFNADGLEVSGDMFCRGISSTGEVRLPAAKISGQLALYGVQLAVKDTHKDCLTLVAAEIDELILGFVGVQGVVDLTDVKARSLWDAGEREFFGKLPKTLKLQGFRYESLREPLSAEQRLEWIECSQRQQHYPGVYAELADAYRRIGRRADAREVGIANERRAREDGTLLKKVWNYLLWKFVRYGYENWRAAVGLIVVIAIGSLLFCVASDHFVATVKEPPDLYPVIYATDAAIPVLDLGQTRTWATDGWLEWVELGLAISGYTLVAAVIAGLAGIFNRDQV
jgi:hypothetical protein